jgi:hypothetical protein
LLLHYVKGLVCPGKIRADIDDIRHDRAGSRSDRLSDDACDVIGFFLRDDGLYGGRYII